MGHRIAREAQKSRRNKPKIPLSLRSSPPDGMPRKSPKPGELERMGKEERRQMPIIIVTASISLGTVQCI